MQGLGVQALRISCCGTPARRLRWSSRARAARVTELQREMLHDLSWAGVATAITYGLDKAFAVLEGWRLLRGTVH
jgi:hypothetical protein